MIYYFEYTYVKVDIIINLKLKSVVFFYGVKINCRS